MRKSLVRRIACALTVGGMLLAGGAVVAPAGPVLAPVQCEAAVMKTVTMGGKVLPITAIVDQGVASAVQGADGTWTCPTIKEALNKVKNMHLESATILIQPGTYREKLYIKQPNLTLAGITSPEYTTIVWDDAEGTPVRPEDAGSGKKLYGLSGSPTVKIHEDAVNFQAVNITFSNDFVPEDHPTMKNRQALAMKNSSDGSSFWHCRFLGRQDTLYTDDGRPSYHGCYLAGDVDFIFGAATAVFDDCDIVSVDRGSDPQGFVTAPSTPANKPGYLFQHCRLQAAFDQGQAYLGRPWHPSSAKSPVSSAVVFRECEIGGHIASEGWHDMPNKDGVSEPKQNRMFEYHNTGDGAVENGDRRQLTDAQAANATMEKYFSGWVPEEVAVK